MCVCGGGQTAFRIAASDCSCMASNGLSVRQIMFLWRQKPGGTQIRFWTRSVHHRNFACFQAEAGWLRRNLTEFSDEFSLRSEAGIYYPGFEVRRVLAWESANKRCMAWELIVILRMPKFSKWRRLPTFVLLAGSVKQIRDTARICHQVVTGRWGEKAATSIWQSKPGFSDCLSNKSWFH